MQLATTPSEIVGHSVSCASELIKFQSNQSTKGIVASDYRMLSVRLTYDRMVSGVISFPNYE